MGSMSETSRTSNHVVNTEDHAPEEQYWEQYWKFVPEIWANEVLNEYKQTLLARRGSRHGRVPLRPILRT